MHNPCFVGRAAPLSVYVIKSVEVLSVSRKVRVQPHELAAQGPGRAASAPLKEGRFSMTSLVGLGAGRAAIAPSADPQTAAVSSATTQSGMARAEQRTEALHFQLGAVQAKASVTGAPANGSPRRRLVEALPTHSCRLSTQFRKITGGGIVLY